MPKFMCVTDEPLVAKANEAARRHGLDNSGEYVRIALAHLLERGLPAEFVGRRSRVKIGRPRRKGQ